jgi:hypothetical protein
MRAKSDSELTTIITRARARRRGVRIVTTALLVVAACALVAASPAAATTNTMALVSGSGPPGLPDPLTKVSTGGGQLSAWTTTSQPPYAGLNLPPAGARWISHGSGAASTTVPKTYTYTRDFTLPACIDKASVKGVAIADDTVTVTLNGGAALASGTLNTPTAFSSSGLQPGLNTLTFVVTDTALSRTALTYAATVTWDTCRGGVKVCKVAGPGVKAETPYTFTAGGQSVIVNAGPAPGGHCVAFPQLFDYGPLEIRETAQPLVQVQPPITVVPAGRFVSSDPAAGKVTVMVDSGVTEASFTNRGPGWMEVCKETVPTSTTKLFDFTVQPPVGPAIALAPVPGGSQCSPPLKVASGTVSVTETVPAGWTQMLPCRTWPNPSLLLTCNIASHVTTATVTGGDESTQTVLYFRNCGLPKPLCTHMGKLSTDSKASQVATLAGLATVIDASPDPAGKVIYFTAKGRRPGVYSVPAGGGKPGAVFVGRPLRDPAGIAVSNDGQRLFVADRKTGSIFVVPVRGGRARALRGTEGSAPRGLEIQTRDGKETVVYTGVDRTDGLPAVLAIGADGDERPAVLAKGGPLRDPDGVAIAVTGLIYVSDHAGGGRVLRIKEGQVKTIATRVRLGDVGGIALSLEESRLMISSVRRATGRTRLRILDLASGRMPSFDDGVAGNRSAGGLHRARAGRAMAWAATARSGKVYRFVPGGTERFKAARRPVK